MRLAPEGETARLVDLLRMAAQREASDLHLVADRPPMLRRHGELEPLGGQEAVPSDRLEALCREALPPARWQDFLDRSELDFSLEVEAGGRFRGNLFRERGRIGAAFRRIPAEIPALGQLGLPPGVERLAQRKRGLILVTGGTGSGKSTTLAALLDRVNRERRERIVTIEDPIEFVHPCRNCVVTQRELGSDTASFPAALRHVLRQDPDIVLIGEMRDPETVAAALSVAETGHLVFSTLHTNSAVQSVSRIIDSFPAGQQAQIRTQLALTLQAVVAQQLVPRQQGGGRVLAAELLVVTPAIRNLIREDKLHQIASQMQLGRGDSGMETMAASLARLARAGAIAAHEAIGRAPDPAEMQRLLQAGPAGREER